MRYDAVFNYMIKCSVLHRTLSIQYLDGPGLGINQGFLFLYNNLNDKYEEQIPKDEITGQILPFLTLSQYSLTLKQISHLINGRLGWGIYHSAKERAFSEGSQNVFLTEPYPSGRTGSGLDPKSIQANGKAPLT
ncbi:hypothetical protein UY3_13202 [Chelonia mydas]|uniref:Uncharacterized protein n=1 Tax=Chelonia mydas TaxID=8469 RepID=M7AY56_CHEMY|nr:hypothetical protein UY3_13202 [Chelonia mydas]